MDNTMIIAILDMSAGNAEVGEMWKETKIFSIKSSLEEVMDWAIKSKSKCLTYSPDVNEFRGNLTITIGQSL